LGGFSRSQRSSGQTDSARDPDQEYIYLWSEMFPSTSYIFSDESSTFLYSTSNGYNYYRILALLVKGRSESRRSTY